MPPVVRIRVECISYHLNRNPAETTPGQPRNLLCPCVEGKTRINQDPEPQASLNPKPLTFFKGQEHYILPAESSPDILKLLNLKPYSTNPIRQERVYSPDQQLRPGDHVIVQQTPET